MDKERSHTGTTSLSTTFTSLITLHHPLPYVVLPLLSWRAACSSFCPALAQGVDTQLVVCSTVEVLELLGISAADLCTSLARPCRRAGLRTSSEQSPFGERASKSCHRVGPRRAAHSLCWETCRSRATGRAILKRPRRACHHYLTASLLFMSPCADMVGSASERAQRLLRTELGERTSGKSLGTVLVKTSSSFSSFSAPSFFPSFSLGQHEYQRWS